MPALHHVAAASLAACLAAVSAAPAEARVPPAPQCLDAREVREVFQPDAHTFAVVQSDGQRYRIDLGGACPAIGGGARARLLAADGWMCGAGNEYVAVESELCPVTGVAPITPAEYAGHARASQTGADGSTTLANVVVKGEARRGFAASHSYCFSPRHVRGWSEDPRGLVVEVNPNRSDGNRYYRVELLRSCPHLSGPVEIAFHSGMGIGVICGNPGDDIRVTSTGRPADFVMTGSDRLQVLGARSGCPIRAVYPID